MNYSSIKILFLPTLACYEFSLMFSSSVFAKQSKLKGLTDF